MFRKYSLFIFLCFTAVGSTPLGQSNCIAQDDEMVRSRAATDDQVKAAMLFNFAKYVKWPDGYISEKDTPFRIGVIGETLVSKSLKSIISRKSVGGRSVSFQVVDVLAELDPVHMLYLPKTAKLVEADLRHYLRNKHVLLVADEEINTEINPVITFMVVGEKVRFSVNKKSANKLGLEISSILLRLAESVER